MNNDNHRLLIAVAFQLLRKKGYLALMDYTCCDPCAYESFLPEDPDRFVFFNDREGERAFEYGTKLKRTLHLQWQGEPAEIMGALVAQGLVVDWDGKKSSAIQVLPPSSQVPASTGKKSDQNKVEEEDRSEKKHEWLQ